MVEARMFDRYIGIDYSGAGPPHRKAKGLGVFVAEHGGPAEPVRPPSGGFRWSRPEVADYVIKELSGTERVIVGIDHAFSFPKDYFSRYGLDTWERFLDVFVEHWPTDRVAVKDLNTSDNPRRGSQDEFRLTDKWTTSAKSVCQFDVPGQVAPSTHAGLPWLRMMRQELGDRVFWWPFDEFDIPEGASVVVEVYPSLVRRRVEGSLTSPPGDDRDAEAVASWMEKMDSAGHLRRYFDLPLSEEEREQVRLEGWILGVL